MSPGRPRKRRAPLPSTSPSPVRIGTDGICCGMAADSYYQRDLAWVHHAGYAQHVEKVGPGIVRLLRDAGLAPGARVLDVGCGSGLLARTLRTEGFAVLGIDASAAMIELARRHEPSAQFEVVRLPTRQLPGMDG